MLQGLLVPIALIAGAGAALRAAEFKVANNSHRLGLVLECAMLSIALFATGFGLSDRRLMVLVDGGNQWLRACLRWLLRSGLLVTYISVCWFFASYWTDEAGEPIFSTQKEHSNRYLGDGKPDQEVNTFAMLVVGAATIITLSQMSALLQQPKSESLSMRRTLAETAPGARTQPPSRRR